MKIIIFGATGMVGQGVLRECLLAQHVETILTIGRSVTGRAHSKLRELAHADFTDFTPLERDLAGYDACFFCLGVSSAGMSELAYRHVTYDFTLAAASVLAKLNPGMTFIYVSGEGTDSSEHGRMMWARVKGETENGLLRLPFKAAYMFRPGFIQPRHGVTSRTRIYRLFYGLLGPLYPLWRALLPNLVTNTEQVGQAMLAVARHGASQPILGTRDINQLAR